MVSFPLLISFVAAITSVVAVPSPEPSGKPHYVDPSPGGGKGRPRLPSGCVEVGHPSNCWVDYGLRILTDVITTVHSDLTPYSCAQHCQSQGYTYAGVEYEHECHCGTGMKEAENRPEEECNMACSGDSTISCGGSWRMEVYKCSGSN